MSSDANRMNPNQIVQAGLAALKQNKFQEAFSAFDTLINRGVVNASIWLAYGYACKGLGDGDKTAEAADKSIALEPRNPRAYILKADVYADTGDHRAAASFYLQALNLAPPPEQTPADLRPELERAQKRYLAVTEAVQNHLASLLDDDLAECGREGERVKTSLDYLTGKKQPYFQQPKKYFFPNLPHIEFYHAEDFSWVPMLEAATETIKEELKTAIDHDDRFEAYLAGSDVQPEMEHDLKDNRDWGAFYLWKNGEVVEENAALCPKTVEIMKKIPMPDIEGRGPNVLFSLLRPNTKIPPHHGFINTRLICHLPLVIPDKCGFRVGNDVREWEEGKVWLFDDTIEHEAWNNSDENRYILLFEVWRPELSETEKGLVTKILESLKNYSPEGEL